MTADTPETLAFVSVSCTTSSASSKVLCKGSKLLVILACVSALTVHRVGHSTQTPGELLVGKFSFIFGEILSLRGEYLISLVILRVVSRVSLITSIFLIIKKMKVTKVSQAAKLRECP